jgi:hypothetical protein
MDLTIFLKSVCEEKYQQQHHTVEAALIYLKLGQLHVMRSFIAFKQFVVSLCSHSTAHITEHTAAGRYLLATY